MLAICLNSKVEERLARLAEMTERSKTFDAREAIERHFEDLEDHYLAADAARNPDRSYSADAAKRELGLGC